MNYDAFISYRREGGHSEARAIQIALQSRGKRCFLDVVDLGRGYFDEVLLDHVAAIPNFILILSPGALDRCSGPQDWLKLEIQQALITGSTIVPIQLHGFNFPSMLPEEIRELPRHQAISYSHEYFDPMVEKILQSLDKPRTHKRQFMPSPTLVPAAVSTDGSATAANALNAHSYAPHPAAAAPPVPWVPPQPAVRPAPGWQTPLLIAVTAIVIVAAGFAAWEYFKPEPGSDLAVSPGNRYKEPTLPSAWNDDLKAHLASHSFLVPASVSYEIRDNMQAQDGYRGTARISFSREGYSPIEVEVYREEAQARERFAKEVQSAIDQRGSGSYTYRLGKVQFMAYGQLKQEQVFCMTQFPGRPWVFLSTIPFSRPVVSLDEIRREECAKWILSNVDFSKP